MFSFCKEIFQELKAIAQTAGMGAVERKMAGLSDVLRQVDSVSAKYVVRILLGNEHGHTLSENHRESLLFKGPCDSSPQLYSVNPQLYPSWALLLPLSYRLQGQLHSANDGKGQL